MTRVILYSRNFKQEVIRWSIEPSDSYPDRAVIMHGKLGGKYITNFVPISEFASRIAKKKKEGYIEIPNDSVDPVSVVPTIKYDDNWNTKPMKCQPFKEKKLKYPVAGQPKLNGLRCTLRWENRTVGDGMFTTTKECAVLRTKEGLEFVMPHITDSLIKEHFSYLDHDLAFDGELYKHNTPLNIIKSSCPQTNSRGTLSKPSGNPLSIGFHVFDLAIPNMLQLERLNMLNSLNGYNLRAQNLTVFNNNIFHVEYVIINNDYEAQVYRDNCLKAGYEGCVLRELDAEYAFGHRPPFIRKFKTFMDSEFLILDIISKPSDPTLPLFICKNDENDETFECNPTGKHDDQREYLTNKDFYIGKFATVRYRERSGVKNAPFHANVIDIRNEQSS